MPVCALADFSKHSVQIDCTETMFNHKNENYERKTGNCSYQNSCRDE